MTTTSPLTLIRPRREDDLEALAAVLVQVHEQDGYPVEGVADPLAWLHVNRPLGAWTAELDGQPLGHVALTEPGPGDDAPRIWHEHTGTPLESIAVLGRLFVAPHARGHGLGRQLTHTATHAARQAGHRAVLDVMTKDHDAIRLYETLGWTHFADIEHHHGRGVSTDGWAYVAPI